MECRAMKKGCLIYIIIVFIVILSVTLFSLLTNSIRKNYSKTNEYPAYDSLEQYTKENTNSEYSYSIIAKNDEYAVCFVDSINSYELKILSKTKEERWIVLSEDKDYKYTYYTNKDDNIDINEIVTYKQLNNEKNIVAICQYMSSGKEGIPVSNADIRKLKNISDSQNTKFYYSANQSKSPEILFAYYIGFVDNFDKNAYTLYMNDKEYPFKEWKKLLGR